jgi:HEPN domain-containing protein
VTEHGVLLAAGRRIIEDAARDRDLGLHESACIGAHRGAVLASEAWLRSRGQSLASNSVLENVSLSPSAGDPERAAAARLDRHRVEEGYPHRSFQGATEPAAESAGAVDDARRILSFVERELAAR